MAYPARLLSPDEEIVLDFRPHWSRILREILLTVAVIVVQVLLALVFEFEAKGWVMAAIGVIWFLLILGGMLSWWFTQHVITNERVIFRAGVVSRAGKEIPLEVINDVSFSQSPWNRLIRSGDLLIESAGEQGQSHYRDIPRPEDMQKVIYQQRENRMMQIERGGGKHPITKAQQLEILARLHDEGKLSDEEFEDEKRMLSDGGGV